MVRYNKLVRNNIPKIITENGEMCIYHQANPSEFKRQLLKKLVEESKEAANAGNNAELAEELADILEVYDALLTEYGISHDDVLRIKKQKKEERGGFEEKIILECS